VALALAVNASFGLFTALFVTGPPVSRSPGRGGLAVLLSQFYPYALLFLFVLAWARVQDREGRFRAIATVRLLRTVGQALTQSPRAVYGLAAGGALLLFAVSARRHWAFESRGDLAIFDQGLWNTANGVFYRSSLIGDLSLFAAHFEVLPLVLTPLYLVAPSPLILLAVQAVMLAVGAIPLFWIARGRLPDHPQLWTVFPIAYLAYLPLRQANRFDYHPGTLVPPLFLFALYFMERARWGPMILFLALAGLLKENMPAAGVSIGLYLLVARRRRRRGAALAVLFAVWFYAGLAWVVPAFNPQGYLFLGNYAALGDDLSSILLAPLTAPSKVIAGLLTNGGWKLGYLLNVFGPLAFLPLLSPGGLFLGSPFLLQHLLASTRAQVSLSTHNAAEVVAFVFFAAVWGAARLVLWRSQPAGGGPPRIEGGSSVTAGSGVSDPARAARALAVVLWATTLLFHGWSEFSHLWRYPSTPRTAALAAALRVIPPGASVAAPDRVLPHLTHRQRLFWFPPLDGDSATAAEYVIVDPARVKATRRQTHDAAVADLPKQGYEPIFQREGVAVWRRVHAGAPGAASAR
jgi:uncharacterized membrane protein